jgi:DNA-binding NarL/FixJ family response regulator
MRTGLGFGLWLDDMDDKDASGEEDLSKHNIFAIRERMQQTYTKLVKRGLSTSEIASMMGTSEQTVQYYLNGIFDEINRFEKALGAI